jgi:hypothetical protein
LREGRAARLPLHRQRPLARGRAQRQRDGRPGLAAGALEGVGGVADALASNATSRSKRHGTGARGGAAENSRTRAEVAGPRGVDTSSTTVPVGGAALPGERPDDSLAGRGAGASPGAAVAAGGALCTGREPSTPTVTPMTAASATPHH